MIDLSTPETAVEKKPLHQWHGRLAVEDTVSSNALKQGIRGVRSTDDSPALKKVRAQIKCISFARQLQLRPCTVPPASSPR